MIRADATSASKSGARVCLTEGASNQTNASLIDREIKLPNNNQKENTAMRQVFSKINIFGVIILLALAVGCTTTTQTQNKENLLIAAGFKVIIPKTAAQQEKLQTLPAGKVSLVQKNGQLYYVFPDAANNQAYVGGPQQYQTYKQLRLANQLSNENLEAAEMRQDAEMNLGAWGGWGGVGFIGRR